MHVNDIWRSIDSNIRLLADDCIIYREITNKNDIEKLQSFWTPWGNWAVENGMKINLGESKVIRFTRARVKNPLVTKKFWKEAVVNIWE